MLNERQSDILTRVIRTYVREAHPVGSTAIVADAKLDVSPATVRNEMLALEELGYLFQPHTSAGRVPTERAWRYYLDHVLSERSLTKHEQAELERVVRAYQASRHELMKHLAQSLAELTRQAVFVAFGPRDTYYTGISKLFLQPEFEELDLIRNISRVVDHLDDVMPDLYDERLDDVTVLLGRESRVSAACSVILAPIDGRRHLLGLLGPIRQDYDAHLPLLRYARSLVTS